MADTNPRIPAVTLLKAAGAAAGLCLAVNALFSFGMGRLLGVDPAFEPVHPISSLISTSMWLAMGTIALFLVARFSKKSPARTYLIVSIVGLAISFIPNILLALDPSKFPGASNAGMAILAVQHILSFAIWVPIVLRALRRTS